MYSKFYNTFLMLVSCSLLVFTGTSVLNAQGDITPSEISAGAHPKFVNSLPIPVEIDATKEKKMLINMRETTQWLGLVSRGKQLQTDVWGYGPGNAVSYPGPTLRADKDVPVDVTWRNQLPKSHLLPVDYSLHMAKPSSGIPTVTHLHGGHTESASDGLPEAWFTNNFKETGPFFVKDEYHYDNDQDAATLWYHDHALGFTRLNVYAGLAGFYLLSDENERELIKDGVLPKRKYEIEVVIQDRSFDARGQLLLPTEVESEGDCVTPSPSNDPDLPVLPDPAVTPVPTTSAVAEFFGDFILVNGMTWPVLNVEPRKYRIRLLNGSDSRFYALFLDNAVDVLQIGSDDGLLPRPVPAPFIVIAPGERYDLIMDFAGLENQTITMLNAGPDEPFKGGNFERPYGRSTGQIMQFKVDQKMNPAIPDASVNNMSRLRDNIMPLTNSKITRELALFEGRDQYCRLRPQLGTVADGSQLWDEEITENPGKGDVEVWRFYNATEDAHPIHIHLVKFQVKARGYFMGEVSYDDLGDGDVGGTKQYLKILGKTQPMPQRINLKGWKDTEIVKPGEYVDVIAKYDREGRYVWHCHILSHEDHEMMRPFEVGGNAARLVQATPDISQQVIVAQDQAAAGLRLEQNVPNPFKAQTQILFEIPEEKQVSLDIYNLNGQLVKRLANQVFPAGEHTVFWDGSNDNGGILANGMYVYRIMVDGEIQTKRLMMNR